MRVLAALSGGVDSSVTAALLRDEGHDVVGVTMKLWGGESDTGCCSVADVEDARRAAAQATPEAVARLRLRVEAHEHARQKLDEFLPRDMEFHREIAAMSGNPIFPALVEAMFGWLGVYYVQLVRLEGAEDVTIAEHRRILAAIAAGDPEAAAEAMHDHISRGNALYRKFEARSR